MYLNIVNCDKKARRAFTLAEVLVASFVGLLVVSGTWSIYHMAWRWWYETAPLVEAQRIARVALSSVIEGTIDPTAGQDSTYGRRNGIAWAVYEPVISSNISTADKIEFGLEKEKEDHGDYPTAHNEREFYLGLEPQTGLRVVYYEDDDEVVHTIKATLGITDLKFEKFKDVNDKIHIKVTATVEKDVAGTRAAPYHIKVEYIDYVYLRNA